MGVRLVSSLMHFDQHEIGPKQFIMYERADDIITCMNASRHLSIFLTIVLPSGHNDPKVHNDPSLCCDNFTQYKNK